MKLPHGYGSISKMTGNRRKPFMIRKNGKVVGYTKTREEGLELLAQLNQNPFGDNENLTFSEVYDLLVEHKCPNICEKTALSYKSKYKKCVDLYDIPYKDLRLFHFTTIIDKTEKSFGSKNNMKKFFRAMDSVAFEFDVITKEYSKLIPVYRGKEISERTPFSEEEITILWDNLEVEDVDFVLILVYTGMRMGEIENLELENIKLEENILRAGNKTRAGRNRIIPIHHRIKPLIEDRMKLAKGSTLFNVGNKQLRVRFKKVMNKLGMKHIPHECRHTMRTRLDNLNINSNTINLILGHQTSGVGERYYTHKTVSQLIEAVEKLK